MKNLITISVLLVLTVSACDVGEVFKKCAPLKFSHINKEQAVNLTANQEEYERNYKSPLHLWFQNYLSWRKLINSNEQLTKNNPNHRSSGDPKDKAKLFINNY